MLEYYNGSDPDHLLKYGRLRIYFFPERFVRHVLKTNVENVDIDSATADRESAYVP